jgi:hypothetical protein
MSLIEDNQQEKAKEALKAGLAELKLEKLPVQDVLYDEGDGGKKFSLSIKDINESDLMMITYEDLTALRSAGI